ncbi:hypothetical protein [Streptomyces tropicalis]|uniref:Sigma-like protein n=1 Tax=Streptomyces tropicalis TaxID=3034234 RepID=A0ABT6A7A0_9ACTN|nr:hypothetical protein [Streptomyces tropicalis]MDF3300523.1 hypothetical protein [Streptomyces tropicalis]
MSDEKTTDGNIHATEKKPGTVSTDNIHATTEPLKGGNPLTADAGGDQVAPDNIHATDERA